MKPLISVVTVCWNSVGTIERTLKSVLNQSFLDYEYIVVDGGSTDGTVELLKKYEALFNGRMLWKSEPDKGIYDAFNKGINRANGELVWIVNSDDWMERDALSVISDTYNRSPVHNFVMAFAMHFVDANENILRSCFPSVEEKHLRDAYKKDYVGVPHPAVVVPRYIYKEYGMYDNRFRIIGDADWFHRLYGRGVKFQSIPLVITNMSNFGVSNTFDFRINSKDRLLYLKKNYGKMHVRILRYMCWIIQFYRQKMKHIKESKSVRRMLTKWISKYSQKEEK